MSKRNIVSMILSVSCVLLLAACGESETTTTNSSNATAANKTATTTTTPATTTSTPATPTTTTTPATTTTTGTGEKIGVPECDDFITKYEACIANKVPETVRAQFNTSLKQWRDSWRQAAATPQGKAGLAQGCKVAATQAQQTMKSFGCDF